MAGVVLTDVSKFYAEGIPPAVDKVNLEIRDGEFAVLVGPSGCGKSTTLRMIAGLEEISDGTIRIGDRVVNSVPPKDRDVAMVFQNYALYPHMTVYDNMAFGLKLKHVPKNEIKARVMEAAEILGITEYLQRRPRELSGGQRQRVAVGRAIVRNPKVFLFDEPLSNLDAKMRTQMRAEIKRLHHRINATMIYVTHDQTEAMTMGDRIIVMSQGHVLQSADPMTLYRHPNNRFTAGFIGTPPMNFLEGTVSVNNGMPFFTCPEFELALPDEWLKTVRDVVGKPMTLGIRPEDIAVAPVQDSPSKLCFEGSAELIEPLGAETLLHATVGNARFIARAGAGFRCAVGERLRFTPDLTQAHLFAEDGHGVL